MFVEINVIVLVCVDRQVVMEINQFICPKCPFFFDGKEKQTVGYLHDKQLTFLHKFFFKEVQMCVKGPIFDFSL